MCSCSGHRFCADAALDALRRFGPYFVSPVIAGLDPDTSEPYLAGMDTIGAIETAKDFMVAGTAPDSLYGMCESMWRPSMVRAGTMRSCQTHLVICLS